MKTSGSNLPLVSKLNYHTGGYLEQKAGGLQNRPYQDKLESIQLHHLQVVHDGKHCGHRNRQGTDKSEQQVDRICL